MHGSILLIEDHKDLAETIYDSLESAGYQVDYASDGFTGIELATSALFDVIILDVMLPGINGFQVCQNLREQHKSTTPILMLTAKDTLQDKLEGFQSGADDYLVKPFDMPELIARLAAMIKRYRGEIAQQLLHIEDLKLDPETMVVTRADQTLKLPPICFNILRILMRESPRVVTRAAIEQELWGDCLPDSDTLRSHLYVLRKAVDKPFEKELIQTVKGIGFKIEVP